MKRMFLILGLLLYVLLVSCQGKSNDISTSKGNEVSRIDLDNFIKHQIDSLKVTGLSLAIIRDNRIVYSNEFGHKNLVTKEKCNPKMLFEACYLSNLCLHTL